MDLQTGYLPNRMMDRYLNELFRIDNLLDSKLKSLWNGALLKGLMMAERKRVLVGLRDTYCGNFTNSFTSAGYEWDPEKWDAKSGRALGHKREETRQLNSFLETMQSKIYEAQRELLNKGQEVTITSVRNKLRGIAEDNEPKITILEVYRNHVEEVKALVGKEYALGTLKKISISSLFTGSVHQA